MTRNFKTVFVLAIVFIIANPIKANALFGSECRDAKNSYKKAMIKFDEASKKYEIGRKDYEARLAKAKRDCLANTQKAIKENPTVWNLAKPDKKGFCDFLPYNVTTSNMAENPVVTKKRAMEIITNYKQCFSVDQYLDAKVWLRENK